MASIISDFSSILGEGNFGDVSPEGVFYWKELKAGSFTVLIPSRAGNSRRQEWRCGSRVVRGVSR